MARSRLHSLQFILVLFIASLTSALGRSDDIASSNVLSRLNNRRMLRGKWDMPVEGPVPTWDDANHMFPTKNAKVLDAAIPDPTFDGEESPAPSPDPNEWELVEAPDSADAPEADSPAGDDGAPSPDFSDDDDGDFWDNGEDSGPGAAPEPSSDDWELVWAPAGEPTAEDDQPGEDPPAAEEPENKWAVRDEDNK